MADANGLVAVELRGLPVPLFARTQAHYASLLREFALIAFRGGAADVPARLTQLVQELRGRYATFTQAPTREIRDAIDAGVPEIDVTFRVPPEIRDAAMRLGDLLVEADEFCARGELLSLASPPDVGRLRRWYLEEFARQLDGAAPRAWSDAAV